MKVYILGKTSHTPTHRNNFDYTICTKKGSKGNDHYIVINPKVKFGKCVVRKSIELYQIAQTQDWESTSENTRKLVTV